MNGQFWYRALYLKERVNLLRKKSRRGHTRPSKTRGTSDITRERIRTWRRVAGLESAALFHKRLKQDDISEVEFKQVISEKSGNSITHTINNPSSWMRVIKSLVADDFVDPDARDSEKSSSYSFTTPLKPFISYAIQELEIKILKVLKSVGSQTSSLQSQVRNELIKNLEKSLVKKATPSLVLELNIARLEGNLTGSTKHERFNSFCQRFMNHDEFLKFLQQYPVLARLLAETTIGWIKSVTELLTRLIKDWSILEAEFLGPTKFIELISIKMSLSDVHRGGHTVCELTFTSGRKLMYKPKPLQVDLHFQDFLRWLNNRGVVPNFRTVRVLDRGRYGWMEYIQHKGCETVEEVQRFYQQQGGYLAILYALGGVDIHRENLVAFGEYPVIVDIETLFHHTRQFPKEGGVFKRALALVNDSVMRVGLLPTAGWTAEREADNSGLGGKADLTRVHFWGDKGTDEMHLVSGFSMSGAAANRILLRGIEVEPQFYIESIIKGFETAYKIILNQRDELLSNNGPVSAFARDTMRHVFKNTKTYYSYLEKGYHPDNLQNGLDRERLMDHLWANMSRNPRFETIIKAEHDDLMSDNIPIFTSKPSSLDLYDSKNRCITNFWDVEGVSIVKSRIAALNQDDLTKQVYFIRVALTIPREYGKRHNQRTN